MATQDRTQHAQTIAALEKIVEAIEKLDRRLEAIEERVDSIDTNTSSTAWDVGQHGELHDLSVTLSNIEYALRGPVIRIPSDAVTLAPCGRGSRT
jgi:hypothetical protein